MCVLDERDSSDFLRRCRCATTPLAPLLWRLVVRLLPSLNYRRRIESRECRRPAMDERCFLAGHQRRRGRITPWKGWLGLGVREDMGWVVGIHYMFVWVDNNVAYNFSTGMRDAAAVFDDAPLVPSFHLASVLYPRNNSIQLLFACVSCVVRRHQGYFRDPERILMMTRLRWCWWWWQRATRGRENDL